MQRSSRYGRNERGRRHRGQIALDEPHVGWRRPRERFLCRRQQLLGERCGSLIRVGSEIAVVARIADGVAVDVILFRVEQQRAVVDDIHQIVAIRIGGIRVIDLPDGGLARGRSAGTKQDLVLAVAVVVAGADRLRPSPQFQSTVNRLLKKIDST